MATYGGISLKNKSDSITICSEHDFFVGEVKDYIDGLFDESDSLIKYLDKNNELLPATKTWLFDLKKYFLEADRNNICDIAKLMFMRDLVFFFRQDIGCIDNYVSNILHIDGISGKREYVDIYGSGKKATEYLNIKEISLSDEFKVARIVLEGSDKYIDIKYKGIGEKELIAKIHQLPVFISELFCISKKEIDGENCVPMLLDSINLKINFYNNKKLKDSKYPVIDTVDDEVSFLNDKADRLNRIIPLCFSAAELASAIILMLPANVYPLTDGESLFSSKKEPSLKLYLSGERMTRFYSQHDNEEDVNDVSIGKYYNTCSRVDALWSMIGGCNLSGLKTVFEGGDKENGRVYTDVDMDILIQVNPFDYR